MINHFANHIGISAHLPKCRNEQNGFLQFGNPQRSFKLWPIVALASAFGLNDLPAHLQTPFQNPIARNPLLVIKRLAALSVAVIHNYFVIHNVSLGSF